jgi:hypothetical protein
MPRFYFHTEDGGVQPDEDGVDVISMADARRQAVRMLGELLQEQPERFLEDGGLKLTVTDERGLVLFVLDASATDAPAGAAPRARRPDVNGPD